MSRKTVNIENLKYHVNTVLLNSPDDDVKVREGVISMVELLLMEVDSYAGFEYLDSKNMLESVNGTTVGIHKSDDITASHKEKFSGTDHTRVRYC